MADTQIHVANIEPTRLFQAIPHDPHASVGGDCYRTTIACLLGLDEPAAVPHFVQQQSDTGDLDWENFRLARQWLRTTWELDLRPVDVADAIALGVPYIGSVNSLRGPWLHAVIFRDGQVIHDPSGLDYTGAELVDPIIEVLSLPYEPAPDVMVAAWRAEALAAGGLS